MLTVDRCCLPSLFDCNGPTEQATSAIIFLLQSSLAADVDRDLSCRAIQAGRPPWFPSAAACRSFFLSSSGMAAISSGGSPFFSRRFVDHLQRPVDMVSVRKPRKSNFTSPAYLMSVKLGNRMLPSSSQYSGAKSVILVGAMHTPPACAYWRYA